MGTESVFQDGPHLLMACLCESVLQEKSGVKSAIRLIDRLTMTTTGRSEQDVSANLGKFPNYFPATLLVKFVTGEGGVGEHKIAFALVSPTGEQQRLLEQKIRFDGPAGKGVDWVAQVGIPTKQPGIYWLEVFLDGIRITRVPFTVIITTRTIGDQIEGQKSIH